ncbi:hypothetical protein BV25DRAFT_1071777 [Artomyces pyxidatus]|uniref:Uncharacterized protein n=1 Tax=Artomyces pyxidatus TaxID=48021 RepID=A0ACB8TFJ1_9AGAM|nr:hypothetical protein BV25DRAFT_1071777 [Artomyces pyxidatus]
MRGSHSIRVRLPSILGRCQTRSSVDGDSSRYFLLHMIIFIGNAEYFLISTVNGVLVSDQHNQPPHHTVYGNVVVLIWLLPQ